MKSYHKLSNLYPYMTHYVPTRIHSYPSNNHPLSLSGASPRVSPQRLMSGPRTELRGQAWLLTPLPGCSGCWSADASAAAAASSQPGPCDPSN